jgi:hypothetical protein
MLPIKIGKTVKVWIRGFKVPFTIIATLFLLRKTSEKLEEKELYKSIFST